MASIIHNTSNEHPAIARVRRCIDRNEPITSMVEDQDFVFALLSNRHIFDAVVSDQAPDIWDIADDVIDGSSLIRDQLERALREYDRLLVGPEAELTARIDQLQVEIDSLRAELLAK